MSHKIEQKYYQVQIRDFAEEVRDYLANALVPCVGDRVESFVTQLILAKKNGEPLPSWRLSPECLLENAAPAFLQRYAREVESIRQHISPGSARGLPLEQMVRDRLRNLDAGQRQEFLQMALSRYTDQSAIYNILRFCANDNPALCDGICQMYKIPRDAYYRRLGIAAKEAMDDRNIYLGHANTSLYYNMTPADFTKVIEVFLRPAEQMCGADTAPLEALRRRRNDIVRCAHSQPLSLQYLESAVPEFDRFLLVDSRLGVHYDREKEVLYLHPLQEVQEVLRGMSRRYDSGNERLRRQEQKMDSIQETQLELKSSISLLTQMVQAGAAVPAPAAPAPAAAARASAAPPVALQTFPHMQGYTTGRLTETQQAEIFSRCHVLADVSCWLCRDGQRFVVERVLPLQGEGKKRVIVDWATRVELYNMETAPENSDQIRTMAHEARILMSHLHRQGKIRYAPERPGVRSSHSSLIDVVTRNPGKTVCLLTMDWDFCAVLAKKDFPNVMPLLVGAGPGCSVHPVLRPLVKRNSMGVKAAQDAVQQAAAAPRRQEPVCICETEERLPWKKAEEGMTLVTGSGETVCLGAKVAEGGEGEVFATGDAALVAKLYNKRHLTVNRRDKLALMLEQPPMPQGVCWPTALLYHTDDQTFAGFLMPRVSSEYKELTTSVLQLGKPSVQRQLEGWDRLALVRLCLQLCRLLERLHRTGILLGDINPRNLLVRTENPREPALMVVDCDSCQIGGYPCPVGTRLHTSPAIYKRLNTTSPRYGSFLRTEQDEDYAAAVLMFELLMLNQSPFSSKGVTDMGQAVRDGKFAYRFTPKGSTEAATDGSDTPDGPYRMIWGNMPYGIREGFYNTFALGQPPAMSHWISALQCYEHDIGNNTYTRELTPNRYFDVNGTYTQDFTCEECGAQSNMPRQRWENNHRYGHMNLCNTCYSAMLRLQNDRELVPVHCVCCGKSFPGNKWQATLESRGMAAKGRPRDRMCPDCRQNVQVTCARCGKQFPMAKGKLKNLEKRGKKPRCRDCFEERN